MTGRRASRRVGGRAFRIFDTAAQLRDSYGYPPVPLAFEQTAFPHPLTQRRDVPLSAPTYREPVSSDLMHLPYAGECLTPFFPDRRCVNTFDARLRPRDGDYVLLAIGSVMRYLLNFCAERDAVWAQRYAGGLPDVWVKQLRSIAGGAWLVTSQMAMPLGDCQILGTLVNHNHRSSLACV